MASIVEINNPFEPMKDTRVREHRGGITIRKMLKEMFPGFVEFKRPTVCFASGRPLLRAEWEKYIIGEDEVICFNVVHGDAITVLYWLYAVLVVATVVMALSTKRPGLNGQTPQPDPTYTLSGQRNQNRLGNPIEVPYGRNRMFPSYAAASFNKFINNDQYEYSLYCLGKGQYDISAIQFEDTAIANFQDVTYQVYQPGETVTLFPDNVVTSADVGGIELLGTNETTYIGLTGPFTANPAGTVTTHLEVDVSLPNGLYFANNDGSLGDEQATALFEYRQIDDSGAPLTGWFTLATFDKTLRTNTPQRFTLEADVTSGRYEVRASRTNPKNTDSRAGNTIRWDGMRSFLPSTKVYPGVTIIAVVAKATNNLNDNSAQRFNVIGTRMLRIWDGTSWSGLTATRSIVWAYCDNFQASYGGQLSDGYLNLAGLLALDAIYTGLGWTFDWIFEQKSTVWEQAQIIARCGRAIPMLNGSQVTMIRDYSKSLPTAHFNQENIVQNTFKWEVKLANIDEFDGLEIEYTDPTSFLQETVLCLVDGEEGDNPDQVTFPGCQDRTRAYQEGLYERKKKLYLVEQVTFSTGLEGQIPKYGALISVAHDIPRWGQAGLIKSIVGTTVTLNEPVTFGAGTNKLAIRAKDGTVTGPFVVTAGSDAFTVILGTAIDTSLYFFDDIHELPLFYFGVAGSESVLCQISNMAPADNGTVEITAYVYDDGLFSDDGTATPPPLPTSVIPASAPDIPVLNCALVSITPSRDTQGQSLLTWAPALGASSYNVQTSSNGTDWIDAGSTTANFLVVEVEPGQPMYARVQPVGAGAGAWCSPLVGPGSGSPAPDRDNTFAALYGIIPLTEPVQCRGEGGTGDLCGIEELADQSDPVRVYKKQVISGSIFKGRWNSAGCPCEPHDGSAYAKSGMLTVAALPNPCTFSWIASFTPAGWNPVTGAQSFAVTCSAIQLTNPDGTANGGSAGCRFNITKHNVSGDTTGTFSTGPQEINSCNSPDPMAAPADIFVEVLAFLAWTHATGSDDTVTPGADPNPTFDSTRDNFDQTIDYSAGLPGACTPATTGAGSSRHVTAGGDFPLSTGGTGTIPAPAADPRLEYSGVGMDIHSASTQVRYVGNDSCNGPDTSGKYFRYQGEVDINLTLEDTEADLIARLISGGWDAFAYCTPGGDPFQCCKAEWEQRSTGLSLTYVARQFKIHRIQLVPNWTYKIDVPIYRRFWGSSDPWELYTTLHYTEETDGSGVLDFSDDVPNLQGFETACAPFGAAIDSLL